MKVDKQTLEKIAHLSRLEIAEHDAERLTQDLSKILDWVDQLDEVDTEGVAPLTTMTYEVNATRADEAQTTLDRDAALKNAPEHDGEHFIVPKVLK